MNRRQALSKSAAVLGGTFLATAGLLPGCAPKEVKVWSWSEQDVNLLDELGEVILPTTATSPGAKEARVGEYIRVMVKECLDEDQQKAFGDGMVAIDELSETKYKKVFMELSVKERHDLLIGLDNEAIAYDTKRKPGGERHYFSVLKNLTMEGYFTSGVGATKALRYVPIPARYDGCIEYTPGTPAWA